ncbi:MAG: 23S rRNA (pseudouridine(1915)-N(3))-methyltransferase RlmH [Oscillospiraceae bacterium]|jgi:23S rRNA (pseudouridine1915-N3)-methyltransferase|nr:23S rRNA (pseudouridine(1915)-N(3))-methyltransferase RlmH [Oscillospiraceae bacterium]
MKIKIICVGKLKEKYLTSACEEYIKRLSVYCKLEITELTELATIEAEAEYILKNIRGYAVALCIEGKQLTSVELAKKIETLGVDGISEISFIIGSSDGLSDRVKNKVDFKLSMSAMTFPHQLARVLLLEQIYRVFQINTNGKYHK